MIPAKCKVVVCPVCGGPKDILRLASGNTFRAKYWTDYKPDAPSIPKVSFVQECPHCGHYFVLTQVKKDWRGSRCTFHTGRLNWEQMKKALTESLTWNDTDEGDQEDLLMEALWSFNDEFYHNPNGQKKQPSVQDLAIHHRNLKELISLQEPQEYEEDAVFVAELYRELGDFDNAISCLENYSVTTEDLAKISVLILEKAREKNHEVFCYHENS